MKPGKVLVKARQIRLDHQAKIGRIMTLSEAAAGIGMEVAALSRIENAKTSGVDFSTLARICSFYGVQVCDILEYTEDESRIAITENSEDGPDSESEASETLALNAGPSSFVRRPAPVLA